jgi:hypothetical protein
MPTRYLRGSAAIRRAMPRRLPASWAGRGGWCGCPHPQRSFARPGGAVKRQSIPMRVFTAAMVPRLARPRSYRVDLDVLDPAFAPGGIA